MNSLKSILTRLTTVDDAVEAMEAVGVSIYDTSGEMRSATEILGDLASTFPTLTKETQASLATTVAGRYQVSRFLTLMSQWDEMNLATEASVGSVGSAMREQSVYSQSLEARLNRLQNAGTELSLTLGDALLTDSIVVFTEAVSGLANTSSDLINFVGLLPPVFGGLAVAVAMLNPKFRAAAMDMSLFQANAHGAAAASRFLTVSLRTLAASTGIGLIFAGVGFGIEKLISLMGDSIKRNEEFRKSQETSLESMATQRSTVSDLVDEYEKLSNIPEVNRNIEQEQRYTDLQNELVTLLPHVKEGEDEKGNAIVANTERVREHIAVLEEQLAYEQKLAAETAEADIEISTSNIEDAHNKIAKYQENLAKEQKKQQDLIDKGRVDAANIISTQIDKWNQKIQDQYDIINENQDKITGAFAATAQQISNMGELDLSNEDVSWIGQMAQEANMSETEIKSLATQISELRNELSGEISLQGLSNDQIGIIKSITDNLKHGSVEWDKYRNALENTGIDSDRLTNILGYLRNSEEELANAAKEAEVDIRVMSPTFSELGEVIGWVNGYIDESTDSMDENGQVAEDWSERISNAKDNFEALAQIILEMVSAGEINQATTLMQKDAYEALAAEVSPLNGLLETLAEGKSISASEAMNLINKEEALTDAISIENGVVKVNEQAVRELRDAKVQGYSDMQKAVIDEVQQVAEATRINIQNYGIEIKAIKDLASARIALNDVIKGSYEIEDRLRRGLSPDGSKLLTTNPLIGRNLSRNGATDGIQAELDAAKNQIGDIIGLYDQVENLSGMVNTSLKEVGTSAETMEGAEKKREKASKDAEKSMKTATASLEESKFVADAYARVIEELNAKISILNNLHNDQAKHSKAYRDSLKKEIKLLEQKQKVLERQAKSLRDQIKNGNITQYGINTTSTPLYLSEGTSSSSGYSGSTYTGQYASSINAAAKKYGVNPNLIAAIIKQESNFNARAVSKSGAQGLMQLMPATARSLGVKNSFDAHDNIMGGTKYIAQQLKAFGGDLKLALAAYNAGPGNVKKHGGIPPFEETQDYVNKVIKNLGGLSGAVSGATSDIKNVSSDIVDYYIKNFRVTSDFGMRKNPITGQNKMHEGVDLANGRTGDAVKAIRSGKVVTAGYHKTAGNWVVIDHGGGLQSRYMHMLGNLPVKKGQTVQAGQTIGRVGSTGNSTGAHLHLEVRHNGKAIDPMSYLTSSGSVVDSTKNAIGAYNDASRAEAERQQAVWQAESDLLGIQQEISSINDLIEELRYEIIESHLAEFDWLRDKLSKEISRIDYEQMRVGENTSEWIKLQHEREKILKQQRDHSIDAVNYAKDQLKYNKELTKAQKARLDAEILDRTNELWDMEQEILSQRIKMAEQIIDTYNRALQAQKDVAVKAIDDLMEEIDKEMNDADWNKRLRDQQKERQEILDEMTSLALDDSDSARKRMAELEKLLQESEQSIEDMQKDREVELRKESLQEDRKEVENYYDELINDERRLAKMRSDIINGSTNKIQKDLEKFHKDLSKSSGDIGKHIINSILDALGVSKEYLDGAGKVNVGSFDTGGWYTGSFNGGRLAMLHQKELVLNKKDTPNLLKAVDWTRSLVNNMKNLSVSSIPSLLSGKGEANTLTVNFDIGKVEGGKDGATTLIDKSIEGFERMGFKLNR